MKLPNSFPVVLVTVLLVVYHVFLLTSWSQTITGILFFLSPFLIIWMVYRIIRFDTFRGNELMDDEEWGYADKNKDELNMF